MFSPRSDYYPFNDEPGCMYHHRCPFVHRLVCHVRGCGATLQLVAKSDCEGCGRMECSNTECLSNIATVSCCHRELCGLCRCKIEQPPRYLVCHEGHERLVGSIRQEVPPQHMCTPCLLGPPFRHAVDALEGNVGVAPNVEHICKRLRRRALNERL